VRNAATSLRRRGWAPLGAGLVAMVVIIPLVAIVMLHLFSHHRGHSAIAATGVHEAIGTRVSRWDWSSYGHDPQHTFDAQTTLRPADIKQLKQAWFFHTGDAVTAQPTVVNGVVYVGSWDGFFYSLKLSNGALRWKFHLHAQPAVTPQPGQHPRDNTSDGGLVTSSAWFEPGNASHPDLIVFGGGYTLYALEARTGKLYWSHDFTGRPDLPPNPMHDNTRIFSSPVVVGDKVMIGVSSDGEANHRGYIVAANLSNGNPDWVFQTDVDTHGRIQNDGCGGVWSSGTVLPALGFVVFTTADCNNTNAPPLAESVIALHITDGKPAWIFRPDRTDAACDQDFGASVNAGIRPNGTSYFLGAGGKDGTYYSLNPVNGKLRWSTNVVFGGPGGGFMAPLAFDGTHLYGATGLGDVNGPGLCQPNNPRDEPIQEPSVDAFSAATGKVLWQGTHNQSFGATTVAGEMTFNGPVFGKIVVREKDTRALLQSLPIAVPCWCGIAVVRDAVIFGIGTPPQSAPDGIAVYTPGGRPPTTP
jgi:outer membrane protein assembly factor BamB